MSLSVAGARARAGGFTLVELVSGTVVVLLGLMALAGVLVSTMYQNDEITAQNEVSIGAQSVMEMIKSANPVEVAKYHGKQFRIPKVSGNFAGGAAIQVAVDTTNPRLVGVTLSASWDVNGRTFAALFRTDVFNPDG